MRSSMRSKGSGVATLGQPVVPNRTPVMIRIPRSLVPFASWFAAPLAALLFAACQTNPPTKGKLEGDTYSSPHGNFTMPIPLGGGLGRRVTDDARDLQGKEGFVSILNDFGEVRSVEYAELPAAERERYAHGEQPRLLEWIYREGVVGLRAQKFPGMRSLHDEPLESAEGPAHFGIAFIPGGSALVGANALGLPSSEHYDTLRAFLVFTRDGFAYTLGCTYNADAMKPDLALTPERIERYKSSLVAMRSSMRFPAPR